MSSDYTVGNQEDLLNTVRSLVSTMSLPGRMVSFSILRYGEKPFSESEKNKVKEDVLGVHSTAFVNDQRLELVVTLNRKATEEG